MIRPILHTGTTNCSVRLQITVVIMALPSRVYKSLFLPLTRLMLSSQLISSVALHSVVLPANNVTQLKTVALHSQQRHNATRLVQIFVWTWTVRERAAIIHCFRSSPRVSGTVPGGSVSFESTLECWKADYESPKCPSSSVPLSRGKVENCTYLRTWSTLQ